MVLLELVACVLTAFVSYWAYNKLFGDEGIISTQSNPLNYTFQSSSQSKSKPTQLHQSDTETDEDNDGKPMTILWGSQSGTAEGFAEEVHEEAKKHGFKAKSHDIEKYDKEKLAKEPFVVFLQATYGEGDPTDNAVEFWEWLKGEKEENHFAKTTYCVFALGNRQYEHFANAGRSFDEKLKEYGGNQLMEVHCGDDDGSLQDDFEEWKKKFWSAAKEKFTGDGGEGPSEVTNEEDEKYHSKHKVAVMSESTNNVKQGIEAFKPSDQKHQSYLCPVVDNRELREGNKKDPDSSTRHVEIDISKHYPDLKYESADNLYIWPCNGDKLVRKVIGRFDMKPDSVLKITTQKGDKPTKLGLPQTVVCRDLFAWYLDVNTLASVRHAKMLHTYAEKDSDKKQLKKWLEDDKGKKEFSEAKYSIMELLEKFPSLKVPLHDFIEWCPKIKARPYTISSSNLVQPKKISITLSLAVTKMDNGRRHEGTATHYLRDLKPNQDRVWIYITPSTFRLPKPAPKAEESIPVVMIGPGTGIAPFRAFMQEIAHFRKQGKHIGPAVLFYGCRNQKLDYIYQDELTEHSSNKTLEQLHLAFSRDANDGKKTYVQHKMEENAEKVWDLLHNKKAIVYVCGGTSMGSAIRDAIVKVSEKHGNFTHERAKEYLKELQDKKRYIAELWS